MIICFIGMLCIFSVCMMKKKAMGAKKMLSAGMIGILCVMNTACASARIVFEEVALETEIDENGFEWVKGTKILNGYYGEEVNVVIPEGCTEIRCMAFQTEEGKRIKSVTIPASVQQLHLENIPSIFENCDNLEEIVISDENLYYSVAGGEIRNNYRYIEVERDLISDEIVEQGKIQYVRRGDAAFHSTLPDDEIIILQMKGNYALERLDFSEGTTVIERSWVNHFDYLKYIIIPEGVKKIEAFNFQACPSLRAVVFPRSLEEVSKEFTFSLVDTDIIMIGKTQQEIEALLEGTEYKENEENRLYTGLDLYLNEEKVNFDYTAPFIDESGEVRIPIIYVLQAASIPSVNEKTLKNNEVIENDEYDDMYEKEYTYKLYMQKDGKEIVVIVPEEELNSVFGTMNFTLDESKKILDLFDMEIKYDKKNYRLDVVSK